MTSLETHARNLEWIRKQDVEAGGLLDRALTTHLEVLELHAPDTEGACSTCFTGWVSNGITEREEFPCPTYQATTQGLGIE